MHQQNENQTKSKTNNQLKTPTVWDDVWEEITSGTEYAIKANISEIIAFIKVGLEHQSWNLRIQSALSITTICTKLQSNIELEQLKKNKYFGPIFSIREYFSNFKVLKFSL